MYCTNCGKPNDDTSRFCMHCGTPLEAPVYPPIGSETQLTAVNERGKHRLRRVALIAAAVIGVFVLLGGAFLVASRFWLRLGANETAKLMPAETTAYLHFSPDIRQLGHISDLSRLQVLAAPIQLLGLADASDVEAGLADTGLDFEQDIMPWIGLEGGIGVVDRGRGEPGIIAAVATRNRKASDRFLQDVQNIMERDGSSFDQETYRDVPITFEVRGADEGVSFTTVNRMVVVASDLQAMENVVDTWKDGSASLARSDAYRQLMRQLPSNRVGAIYLSPDLLQSFSDGFSGGLLSLGADSLNNGGSDAGAGLALSFQNQGVQLDVVQAMDLSYTSQQALEWSQRDSFDSSITGALPGETLFAVTGEDLAGGWQVLREGTPGVAASDFDELMNDLYATTGVDLEDDLLSWMAGAYAIAAVRDRNNLLDLGVPVSPVLVVEVSGRAQREADAAVGDLLHALADDAGLFEETTRFGDVEMQTATDPGSGITLGYGFVGDYLVIALSQDTLEAMATASDDPLADQPAFRVSQKALPAKNHGILYVDVQELVRSLTRDMASWQREDFEQNVAPLLDPIVSISATSLPADRDGFQHSVVFLQLAE